MKWLLFLCLISFQAEAIEQDKALHAVGSYALANTTEQILRVNKVKYPMLKAAALTLSAGYLKEKLDPVYDKDDMSANAVGVLGSSMFSIILYW